MYRTLNQFELGVFEGLEGPGGFFNVQFLIRGLHLSLDLLLCVYTSSLVFFLSLVLFSLPDCLPLCLSVLSLNACVLVCVSVSHTERRAPG